MAVFKSFEGDLTESKTQDYSLAFYHVATGTTVEFKAFLTSLNDNYGCDWEMENIYGRMDAVQTFKATTRTINIGWDIVAGSVAEAKLNHQKIGKLSSLLYPVYESKGATGMTAPPLLRVKFANLIVNSATVGTGSSPSSDVSITGLLGSVDGFSFESDVEDLFFSDSPGLVYPKRISVSCTFTVIHEHPLGFTASNSKRQENFPYGQASPGSSLPGFPSIPVVPERTTNPSREANERESTLKSGKANENQEKLDRAQAGQVLGG